MTCPSAQCPSDDPTNEAADVDACDECCPYECCLDLEAIKEEARQVWEDDPALDPNPTVANRLMRLDLGCSFCPPNRKENATYYKRGKTKKAAVKGRR